MILLGFLKCMDNDMIKCMDNDITVQMLYSTWFFKMYG